MAQGSFAGVVKRVRTRNHHSTRAPSVSSRNALHCSSRNLQAFDASQDTANAFIFRATADERKGKGRLHDVSVAVKDIFCTDDMPTSCASEMLRDYRTPFSATVVERLREEGAAIVGKTNMDEFGMGSENVHSAFGPVLNPANMDSAELHRVAGGSSGGSAAFVAQGLCDAALASDTGGSTRLPAAYCGITGFKPSYGLLSRWGMIAYASSLDCVGIMARRATTIERVFDVLNIFDSRDPTAVPTSTRARAREVHSNVISRSADSLEGLRIGIPIEYFPESLSSGVLPPLRAAISHLKSLGARVSSVSLPNTRYALSAYYVLASAEAASNLGRFDGIRFGRRTGLKSGFRASEGSPESYAESRSEGFGPEVQKRILLGNYALSAEAFDNYFLQAQRVRLMIRKDFDDVFANPNPLTNCAASASPAGKVDILLHPAAIGIAPSLKRTLERASSSSSSYVQDILNVPASLAGLPAVSVPAGRSEGWPIGVQCVGQWGADGVVLRVAKALEHLQKSN